MKHPAGGARNWAEAGPVHPENYHFRAAWEDRSGPLGDRYLLLSCPYLRPAHRLVSAQAVTCRSARGAPLGVRQGVEVMRLRWNCLLLLKQRLQLRRLPVHHWAARQQVRAR